MISHYDLPLVRSLLDGEPSLSRGTFVRWQRQLCIVVGGDAHDTLTLLVSAPTSFTGFARRVPLAEVGAVQDSEPQVAVLESLYGRYCTLLDRSEEMPVDNDNDTPPSSTSISLRLATAADGDDIPSLRIGSGLLIKPSWRTHTSACFYAQVVANDVRRGIYHVLRRSSVDSAEARLDWVAPHECLVAKSAAAADEAAQALLYVTAPIECLTGDGGVGGRPHWSMGIVVAIDDTHDAHTVLLSRTGASLFHVPRAHIRPLVPHYHRTAPSKRPIQAELGQENVGRHERD